MSNLPSNIYEAGNNKFIEEKDRLSNFDLPTKMSKEIIGHLKPGDRVLDVGAGPNSTLLDYVELSGGVYMALDKNKDFLEKQRQAGAKVLFGDARAISIGDDSFDITHTRFVVSHLGGDKQKAISEILRVTKPKGRAIFLEYDWTTAQGSKVFKKVKNFMINGGFLFDADYGAGLEIEIKDAEISGSVKAVDYPSTYMTDYAQVIRLREAGSTDLNMQGKGAATQEWNNILDELQIEASSSSSPGFYFPGIVAVTVNKT